MDIQEVQADQSGPGQEDHAGASSARAVEQQPPFPYLPETTQRRRGGRRLRTVLRWLVPHRCSFGVGGHAAGARRTPGAQSYVRKFENSILFANGIAYETM
ncbi:hypothetical protein GCM10023075_35940 [Streptosporangium album]